MAAPNDVPTAYIFLCGNRAFWWFKNSLTSPVCNAVKILRVVTLDLEQPLALRTTTWNLPSPTFDRSSDNALMRGSWLPLQDHEVLPLKGKNNP